MLNGIIKMFKEKDGFLSGEEMSERLGITRAAIWKKINALRDKGYEISGTTAKGYRLIKSPEFSVEELRTLVAGDFGKEIIFAESLESTNAFAMELAEKGAVHGTVVIADKQIKGKGRLGRTWVSPPKSNIYMSVILRPEIEPKDATLLTIMAVTACAHAIRNSTRNESFPTGLNVKIKWPNDLMLSNKKLGGILTEMKSDPDRILFAVIGIGINVNSKAKDFPPDIQAIATSVREELGKAQSRTLLISGILKDMDHRHKVLIRAGRKPLLEEWKKLSATLGRKVKVTAGRETFIGVAENINDEGLLILRLASGSLKKISAGDVTMLR